MRSCFGTQTRTLRTGPLSISETHHPRGLRTPAHEHDFACLHLVLDGCYRETTRGGTERAGRGTLVFKPAGEVHWNEFPDEGARSLRMEVDTGALPRLDPRLPGRLVLLRDPRLDLAARRLHRELRWGDDLADLAAESLAMELLVGAARMGPPGPAGTDRFPARRTGCTDVARRCKALLEETFRGSVALSDAARELGVHRTSLARAFRQAYGLSVGAYVRRLRVRWVAEELERAPDRSLAELALDAGFSDQSHLTRTFKRLLGEPPGRYRRRLAAGGATLVQAGTFVQDPGRADL